jgi:hypothetical protein
MHFFNRVMSCLFILSLLLASHTVFAGYQLREFETAGTMLYMSFDNASLAGYWKGQTPLGQHKAQITSGALGNGCVAPELAINLQGNIIPNRGTICFFMHVDHANKPLMQMLTTDGKTIMQIGKTDHFLRPWILLPSGKALGREANISHLPNDQWMHMAIAWDQNKGVRFYVNGKLASHQWGSFHYQDDRQPATLKLATSNGIDELWIFDHPLDITQIKALTVGKLAPPSIIAERFAQPQNWQHNADNNAHQTFTPYQGNIPSWAQSLRQLQTQTQQATQTLEPIRFDPDEPTRLRDGFEILISKDKTISNFNQRVANLWQWYVQKPTAFDNNMQAILPTAKPGQAQVTLRAIQAGQKVDQAATFNLLASFLAEGDRRLLDAALTNALADPSQQLATLGIVSCHGLYEDAHLPKVGNGYQPIVTWENMGNDVVARVNRYSESGLHVTLFNFNAQPREITLRPWALSAGQYQLIMGPDSNDDDMADTIASMTTLDDVHSGSLHGITLPSGQSAIELVLAQTANPTPANADPAIDAEWLTWDRDSDELQLTVVNLGCVAAKDVMIEMYADGKLLRKQTITEIEPTTDTLGKYVIRYPKFSSLIANSIGFQIVTQPTEHSSRNNTIRVIKNNL